MRRPGRLTLLAAAGLIAAAIPGLATPAAASDPDYKGWFAAFDLAATRPAGLDQHFANRISAPSANTVVDRLVIDNATPITWRADFGYGFGKGLGNLQVSYWTFDHDDSRSADANGGLLYATLFGTAVLGAISAPAADATSQVNARTYDLDYVRPMMYGNKLTLRWLAGLRHVTFEEETAFEGFGTMYPPALQTKHIESRGTGLRFGVTSHFIFSAHFALDGGVTFSSVRARVDAEAVQTQGSSAMGPQTETLRVSDGSVRGQMLDLDARAVWSYGRLDYYVGYGTSNWEGLVADRLAGVSPASGGTTPGNRPRDSLTFDSVRAGIVWRFGKE